MVSSRYEVIWSDKAKDDLAQLRASKRKPIFAVVAQLEH
jgi:mRNA-degrading endonuclease RelE of RelBE toxin-antitoxin system